jgi:hypothetical protein
MDREFKEVSRCAGVLKSSSAARKESDEIFLRIFRVDYLKLWKANQSKNHYSGPPL